jgi:hypothetical protein
MARITTLEKNEMDRNITQDKVHRATYCIFEKDGEKYFQIDTYGSPNREDTWKSSQNIRFDGKFAKELVSLLINEFWS